MDGLELFIRELEDCMHVPYKWGGTNPLEGFDCSGLVVWGYQRIGMIGSTEDYSAAALMKKFWEYRVPDPVRGALLFFGPALGDIRHIGVAISERMMIEAGGGGRTTQTFQDALKDRALVRRSKIFSRKDLQAVVFPEYPYL